VSVRKYQELIAWQKAVELVTGIYDATRVFPRDEVYGLTSQLRRAAVSIASNIAEGQGRASSGEFIQFLCHARGSLYEVETQIIIANNLNYLSDNMRDALVEKISELGRILNGFITSLQLRKKETANSR
jgi:four helix bundle protein